MMLAYIIGCVSTFAVGIVVGARGYYLYANHMYCKYPEFFRMVMEQKIQRRQKGLFDGK